jgi:hypothetical protein
MATRKGNLDNSNSYILNPDNSGNGFGMKREPVFSSQSEDCFYNLCTKQTKCWGYLPWGRFKDRTHALMCTVFGFMVASLLVSVIVPLVSS